MTLGTTGLGVLEIGAEPSPFVAPTSVPPPPPAPAPAPDAGPRTYVFRPMTARLISPLPTPPSRINPVDFNNRAEAFNGALQRMVEEINQATPGDSAAGLAQYLALTGDGKGAALVGYKGAAAGTRARTVFDRLTDLQSLFDFMTPAEIAAAVARTLTADHTAAINAFLAAGGGLVPDAAYRVTGTLLPAAGAALIGQRGTARWIPGYTAVFQPSLSDGATFVFCGTGPRVHTLEGVSTNAVSGGSIVNPSAADAYTSSQVAGSCASYDLLDFTNRDAAGGVKATPKPFSAAIKLPSSGGVTMRNIRIVPNFNGLAGYCDATATGLGDEWDVGIWEHNSACNDLESVQVVGYWRTAAHLKTTVAGTAEPINGENSRYSRCIFQGYRGVAIRAVDQYRITAVGANSIEIPWSAGHTFAASGTVRTGGVNFAYTGLSFAGDKLTFTGISSTAGATVGNPLRRAGNSWGMAGCQYIDCYISGLYHHARLLATSSALATPFSRPSTAIEWSGEPARGIQFTACTVQGWDDVLLHFGDAGDPAFIACYFESQSAAATVGGSTSAIAAGSRFIAHATSSSAATYPAGNTRSLRFTACTYGPGVDRGPIWSGGTGRFATGAGCFKPREIYSDTDWFPEWSGSEFRLQSPANLRLQPVDGGKTLIGPSTGNSELQSAVGELRLQSGLRVKVGAADGTDWYQADSAKFMPANDNARALGQPANRWSTVYAGTGSINTSDEREKTAISDIPDAVLDAWADVRWRQFKFVGRVRSHSGLIAQQVRDAFAAHGLDAREWGVLCYDEWPDEHDEAGNLVTPAGDRWGVRYDEAQALEAALMRRTTRRLEQQLAALKSAHSAP